MENLELKYFYSYRLHGATVAEMLLIATCSENRQYGMCRQLVCYIDEMSLAIGMQADVRQTLPACPPPFSNSDRSSKYYHFQETGNFFLEESSIPEKDNDECLRELATNNTVLETLTDIRASPAYLALVVPNC